MVPHTIFSIAAVEFLIPLHIYAKLLVELFLIRWSMLYTFSRRMCSANHAVTPP